jgi:hypothetical protein
MATLEERLAAVEEQLVTLRTEKERLQRRLAWWKGAAGLLLVLGLLIGPPQLGQAQGTVEDRLAALEFKTAPLSRSGNELIFTGVNLHLRNGLNNTQSMNGLGNLILGYNEARGGGADFRGGSHNLVIGQQSNYTSFGGIIGGFQNQISGPFAHVLTGYQNGALSFYSCIATGRSNNAANTFAAILGGRLNVASGEQSCVIGGRENTVSGVASVVSGGISNRASGNSSSVSGGDANTASSFAASISGGTSNTASGNSSSVTGGQVNTAAAFASTVGGGYQETIAAGEANDFDWRAAEMLFTDAPPP